MCSFTRRSNEPGQYRVVIKITFHGWLDDSPLVKVDVPTETSFKLLSYIISVANLTKEKFRHVFQIFGTWMEIKRWNGSTKTSTADCHWKILSHMLDSKSKQDATTVLVGHL